MWLSELDKTNTDEDTTPKTTVKGVTIQSRGGVMLEFDTTESAKRFKHYAHSSSLLAKFGEEAMITSFSTDIIFRFVPCTGVFDPNNEEHLRAIEEESGLRDYDITSARWIKKAEFRAENQTVANLKVQCATPYAANHLLTNRVHVCGKLVTVRKDIREPPRCNNCQTYGHLQNDCPSSTRCATCAGEHNTRDCNSHDKVSCVSCGPNSTHPSNSRQCPTFNSKRKAMELRFPENSMPYFPVLDEPWTWVQAEAKPEPTEMRPPPHNAYQQEQHSARPLRQQTIHDSMFKGHRPNHHQSTNSNTEPLGPNTHYNNLDNQAAPPPNSQELENDMMEHDNELMNALSKAGLPRRPTTNTSRGGFKRGNPVNGRGNSNTYPSQ